MDTGSVQRELEGISQNLHSGKPVTPEVGWQLVALVRATLDALELERRRSRLRNQERDLQLEQLEQISQQRDFLLELINSLGQGIAISNGQGHFVYVNDAYAQMLGYTPTSLIGRTPSEAMHQEHAQLFSQSFRQGTPGEASSYETYLRRVDGEQIYVLLTSVSRWHDRRMVGNVSLLVDLTERKRRELERDQLIAQLEQLAATDELTGIFNRRYFFALGDREVKRARRYRHPLSVIMLDIDHFKRVNDTYGHAAGDQVLRAVVERCRISIRESDILGRYGGEEFGVILHEADRAGAGVVAERLRLDVASSPIDIAGSRVPITISAGVADMRQDVTNIAALVNYADLALYQAKQEGRNRVVIG